MYDVGKFFKLLHSYSKDQNDEFDLRQLHRLLLLISIYQEFVIHNPEDARTHEVFQDCFKVTPQDSEKLQTYLTKIKKWIEQTNPVNDERNADALTVSIDRKTLKKAFAYIMI
jgi:maltooligosyltrehalose synthase